MWHTPPVPPNEEQRLGALAACQIMDTPHDARFDRLTYLAQRFYDADVAFIGFIDDKYQWMKSLTSGDIIPPAIEREKSVCQVMVASGRPLVVGDLHTDERFTGHPTIPLLPLHFYAGVPLLVPPGLVIGSLCVLRGAPGVEEDFDVQPLVELAAIAVDELELNTLNRELTRLTRVDALTGLANRRCFDEELARAGQRCRRTGEALSVMLIDIDRFKALNDGLGHQAGDEALRRVGAALGGMAARQDDTLARYGGEEFAAILCGSDESGALSVAGRIRSALAQAAIVHPVTGKVTVSIGIVSRPASEIDLDRMIAQADAALYEAKRRGRDLVVCHEDPDGL